jgi:hypothetical protein
VGQAVATQGAQVEGKLQAGQHNLRFGVLPPHGVDDELQVLGGFAHWNAPDAVVGPEGQHKHINRMPGQHRGQALAPAGAGFAAHAVVIGFIGKLLLVEPPLNKSWEAGGSGQAVARGKAVAEEDYVFHRVLF